MCSCLKKQPNCHKLASISNNRGYWSRIPACAVYFLQTNPNPNPSIKLNLVGSCLLLEVTKLILRVHCRRIPRDEGAGHGSSSPSTCPPSPFASSSSPLVTDGCRVVGWVTDACRFNPPGPNNRPSKEGAVNPVERCNCVRRRYFHGDQNQSDTDGKWDITDVL